MPYTLPKAIFLACSLVICVLFAVLAFLTDARLLEVVAVALVATVVLVEAIVVL